jgi:hypothetical protein
MLNFLIGEYRGGVIKRHIAILLICRCRDRMVIDTKLNDRDKMFLLSLMNYVIKPQINSGLVLWCLTQFS